MARPWIYRAARAALRYAAFPFGLAGLYLWGLVRGKSYRVATVPLANLGGVAWQLDAFARRQAASPDDVQYLFVAMNDEVANPYFLELLKRKLHFVENRMLAAALRPLGQIANPLNFSDQLRYPTAAEIGRHPSLNWFGPEDHAEGQALLHQLGISEPGAWYACFFARDNAYAEQTNKGEVLAHYLNYHSCRNSDIGAQQAAMEFVLAKGGYVIRIGSVAWKPVAIKHPRLIDYPFSPLRSAFGDIYLVCHASFVVGDASGIVDVSLIRDIPFAWINEIFYFCSSYRANTQCIPKLIRNRSTGRILTFNEFMAILPTDPVSLLGRLVDIMNDRGLYYEDNSPDEILALTRAMYYEFVAGIPPPAGGDGYCKVSPEAIWPPFLNRHPELMN